MPAPCALDISRRRHRGDQNSNEAYERNAEQFQTSRELVWHKLRLHPHGLTAKELAAHFGVPLHSISGRVTELKLAGRVLRTPERRDGCAVVVAMSPNSDLLAHVAPDRGVSTVIAAAALLPVTGRAPVVHADAGSILSAPLPTSCKTESGARQRGNSCLGRERNCDDAQRNDRCADTDLFPIELHSLGPHHDPA